MVVSVDMIIYINNATVIATMTSHIDVVAFDFCGSVTNIASYIDVVHVSIKYHTTQIKKELSQLRNNSHYNVTISYRS